MKKSNDHSGFTGREVDILPDAVEAEFLATDAQILKGCVSYQGSAKTFREMKIAVSARNRETEAFNHEYKEE